MSRYDLDAPHGGYHYVDQDEEELRLAIEASLRETTPTNDPSPPPRVRPTRNSRVSRTAENNIDDELALALRMSIEEEERRQQKEAKEKKKAEEKKRKEPTRQAKLNGNVGSVQNLATSTSDKTSEEPTPEELREQVRRSWLSKFSPSTNDQTTPVQSESSATSSINMEVEDKEKDDHNKTTLICLSSSDDEDEEDALVSKKSRKREAKRRFIDDEDHKMEDKQETWTFPTPDEEVPPPDNDPSAMMSDEVIASHLQEAIMRGEDEEDGIPYNELIQEAERQQEEQKKLKEELERQEKERQEKEDEMLAHQIQMQMMEQEEDQDYETGGRYGRYVPNPTSFGTDWGESPPVIERTTRTSITPTGGRVVTHTTTTRSTTRSSSADIAALLARRRSIDNNATRMFDLLEGFASAPPVPSERQSSPGLARFHGIPLNYLHRRHYGDSDSDDDEGMSYEDLLNLPTVERGVDDKNIYPIVTYSKSDTSNPSCSVCLENHEEGDELRILPCFHKFHRACIDPWLETHKTCPVCKHDLST